MSNLQTKRGKAPYFTPVQRGLLQRKCSCGQHTPGGGECEECRKKRQGVLQREATRNGAVGEAPSIVHEVLRSPGQPLDPASRSFMEPRFGRDFSGVRVHTDERAAESTREVQALAYAVGRHVVFDRERYAPGTAEGRFLLAHELAHVGQQESTAAGPARFGSDLSITSADDAAERAADAAAAAVLAGSAPPSLQRVAEPQIQRFPPGREDEGFGRHGGTLPYREATELLKCIKIMGADSAEYCREVVLGEKPAQPLPGEKFGKWALTQNNTDGSATTDYSSDVKIKFDPDASTVSCDEIAFVQNGRVIDSTTKASKDPRANFKERITSSGWTIDRLDQRKYGWYGYNNDGKPSGTVTPGKSPTPLTAAEMTDTPAWNVANVVFDFETCAICKSGTDAAKVYGCIDWGFAADSTRKLKSHPLVKNDSPTAEFIEAIKQWNAQAKKPVAKRNDPDQQALGPFK